MHSRCLSLSRLQSAVSLVHARGLKRGSHLGRPGDQYAAGGDKDRVNATLTTNRSPPFHAWVQGKNIASGENPLARDLSPSEIMDAYSVDKRVTSTQCEEDHGRRCLKKYHEKPVFFAGCRSSDTESGVLFFKRKNHLSTRVAEYSYGLPEPPTAMEETGNKLLNAMLTQPSSLTELLDLLKPRLERREIQVADIPAIYDLLVQLIYRKELQHVPWIDTSRSVLDRVQIQLILSGRFEELLDPLVSHPVIQHLFQITEKVLSQFSTEELIHCAASWLCLDRTREQLIFSEVYRRLLDPKEEITDAIILGKLLPIFDMVSRRDILIHQLILPRLLKLLKSPEEIPLNATSIHSVLFLAVVCGTEQVFTHVVPWICSALKDEQLANDMAVITTCFRLAVSLSKGGFQSSAEQLLDIITTSAMKQASSLSPYDIYTIASFSAKLGIYDLPWAKDIKMRSLEFLFDKKGRISDKANALVGIQETRLPTEVRRQIEEILLENLNDIDVLTLTIVCKSLRKLNWRENWKLRSTIENLLFENVEPLVKYALLRYEALYFLEVLGTHNDPYNVFAQKLYSYFKTSHLGVRIPLHCGVMRYLIPLFPDGIPKADFEALMSIIPVSNINSLLHIAVGLRNVKKPLQQRQVEQVPRLYKALHDSVLNKIDSFKDINHIVCAVYFLVVQQSYCGDDKALAGLLQQLPNFTSKMNSSEFASLCHLLTLVDYDFPNINKDLIEHVVRERQGVKNLLSLFGKIGYSPEIENQRQVLCQILEEQFDEMDILRQLQCLKDCCILEMFPEKIIQKVFSVDYLSKVDAFVAASRDHSEPWQEEAQTLVMMINRSITLERPDLNIPWFHEHFKPTKDTVMNAPEMVHLQQTIKQALIRVLGGEKFIGEDVSSAYGHHIMFECLLDYQDQPVAYTQTNVAYAKKLELKRIAIQPCKMCRNHPKLTGLQQMESRQLEILGYKTFIVSKEDWGLGSKNTWDENLQILKQAILNQ